MNALTKLGLLAAVAFFAHTVLSADETDPAGNGAARNGPEIRSVGPAFLPEEQVAPANGALPSSADAAGTPLPAADLSGLRYFLQTGDAERYQKEVERLQRLYPGWEPPTDLSVLRNGGDPELDQMWSLFGEGQYAEVRRRIDERRTREPGWVPPDDLLEKLAAAEARVRLVNASDLAQYATVTRIAAENPDLLTCANVDVIWRLAEAFAQTDRRDRAQDAYSYILQNCEVPSERIATIQKAIADLPPEVVDELVAEEQEKAGSTEELEAVRADLARLNVSRSLNDGSKADPADLALVEAQAVDGGSADNAMLLGWYHLDQKDFETARSWFQRALDADGRNEATQGLGLALIGEDKPFEAEQILRPEWQGSGEARDNYLAAASAVLAKRPVVEVSAAALAQISEATAAARDANTAQEIGWYAYEIGQIQTAAQWFEVALSWDADFEPAAFGLALSLNNLGDRDRLSALVASWAGRSARISEVGATVRVRTSAAGGRQGGQGGAPVARGCAAPVNPQTLSPNAALARGWCLMDKDRALEAADAFAVALAGGSERVRSEAVYGQSLAYLRIGAVNRAAVAATQASLPPERARELQLDLLAKRASVAFEAGRYTETLLILDERRQYAPEPFDLSELRGYAYLEMRRFDDALQVFEALAAVGHKGGERGVLTTLETRSAKLSVPGD
ncbi:hypothetical protein GCM10011316_11590 [Roseibium aquae]|uniref:Tetratricopeptide repeat protein n=1 Tax=Roseibium aquae TaxID=1323746 RepID=A0A916TE32_9HYPH|nr:cellulose synthase [Roseibium aquae]GGB41335.1 hypothetical protein GCM10011316_11590 [Roseibium aquae]